MRRRDEGLNNSCFVRMLFFCRGRTDKVREVEITTQCPECRGDHLVRDYSRAEIVCEDCGLVLDDMIIDEGPEWRAVPPGPAGPPGRAGADADVHPGGASGGGGRPSRVRAVPRVGGAVTRRSARGEEGAGAERVRPAAAAPGPYIWNQPAPGAPASGYPRVRRPPRT